MKEALPILFMRILVFQASLIWSDCLLASFKHLNYIALENKKKAYYIPELYAQRSCSNKYLTMAKF